MQIVARAVVLGLTYSKGDYEGRPYDNCTVFAQVDLPTQKSNGESVGYIVNGYRFGGSDQYKQVTQGGQVYPALCEMVLAEESSGRRNERGDLIVNRVIKELKYINPVQVVEQPKKAA